MWHIFDHPWKEAFFGSFWLLYSKVILFGILLVKINKYMIRQANLNIEANLTYPTFPYHLALPMEN